MMNDDGATLELTPDEQQLELLRLIADWRRRRYSLQVQARVAKRLDEPYDNLKTELERCEKWLDALDAELAALGEGETEAVQS